MDIAPIITVGIALAGVLITVLITISTLMYHLITKLQKHDDDIVTINSRLVANEASVEKLMQKIDLHYQDIVDKLIKHMEAK